ncbi:VapC family [Moorella glycerini]|uniref:Ribonuclease VapC n=1 Tax=Neomoorella stamsii TaxID=1266720 RepID=A0A9X7J2J6_9FIRM|nr:MULTISPECIES: PIN domain-containing protein [Moorella]PRR72617.1 Ribonuclease VapC20 [Moorella stamsii]CEP67773.1 VapC family [Moorella glycerini]
MNVYLDTSAFLAILDADDENHAAAKKIWENLLTSGVPMICSSYVLVETYALVQRRLGMEALRVFHEDILPLLQVEWIDAELHQLGANAVLTANRRNLSLVDAVSFAVMRKLGIKKAFAFDRHFLKQGFENISER